MSNPRLYTFFQDTANRSIALLADDNLVGTLRDLINQVCQLNLTETLRNCTSPTNLAGIIQIARCMFSVENKEILISTCDDPNLFSNATKNCMANAAAPLSRDFRPACLSETIGVVAVFGTAMFILLAVSAYVTVRTLTAKNHDGYITIGEKNSNLEVAQTHRAMGV